MIDAIRTSSGGRSVTNPFRVESPEKLAPEELVRLFVAQYTQLPTVKQRKHTFIWGSRGSGKSMLVRYLEPRCQALVAGGMREFLDQEGAFLALYCPCKEGQLNKTDLLLLDRYPQLIITEHMLNLTIADRLVACLSSQFPKGFFSRKEIADFAVTVTRLFDPASIAGSRQQAEASVSLEKDPLGWLQALFEAEIRRVSVFLRLNSIAGGKYAYSGSTSGYHDFLLPLMSAVRRLAHLGNSPVYVMLDDADRVRVPQQQIINTWIANRDQSVMCVKVSAQRDEYQTFLTRDGGLIEQPHDYSEIDVEELYTERKADYFAKVRLIANKRLELAKVPTKEIAQFLPPDKAEETLLNEIKKTTAEEWEKAPEPKPGRKEDFITRYARARLFQHLAETKKRKSYAGFENMVHLSSGVIRDFLEPCYLMTDRYESSHPSSIDFIPPEIQNDVLFQYSEGFFLEKFDDIRKGLPPEKWSTVEALATLVQSLGRLFYERLHDRDAREARSFSFTVSGRVSADIEEVLRLGVKHRYFQLRTYSTKEGGGREKWYILNRRLCPIFKLDPTGFEGRLSLTSEMLKLACEAPEKFVRLRLRQTDAAGPEQLTLFALSDEGATP